MLAPWISPLPPVDRVGYHIAHTPEFAWVFRFLRAFPRTSAALVGSTVRDAIMGRLPHTGHLLITHLSPARAQAWLHTSPAPSFLQVTFSPRPISAFLASQVFTPDALAYDIGRGILHDPFDGMSSLQQGLLTTVPDPSAHFRQSPEDAFAALRLSAQLGLSPSPRVWKAAIQHLPRVNHLTTDEQGFATYRTPRHHLVREGLLALKHGLYGWELFSRARAVPFSFPHLRDSEDHEQASSHVAGIHDDQVRSRYGATPLSDTLTAAALFNHHHDRARHYDLHAHHMSHHHVSHPRLSFSRPTVTQTLAKAQALLTENPSLWPLSRTEKVLMGPQGAEAIALAHLATLHDRSLREQSTHIARAALTRDQLVRDVRPIPLLRGRDLLPLGLSSGPHLRSYLNRVRDEQLKGDLHTREDALHFVRTLVRQQL
jgi:hypothetical protein